MKKAVVLISKDISGAEKRYFNLFKYINREVKDRDYYLILNRELFEKFSISYDMKQLDNVIVLKSRIYSPHAIKRAVGQALLNLELYFTGLRRKINLFHCVMGGLFIIFATSLLRPGVKIVYSESYCSSLENFHLSRSFYYRYKAFLKKTYKITTLTESTKQYIEGLGIDPAKISVSPCSFIIPVELKGVKKEKLVVFAGRFSFEKNPMLFVRAAKLVAEKDHTIRFLMLGNGDMMGEIVDYIKENRLTNITLDYKLQIIDDLNRSSVFCSVQKFTNYPSQSLLEAMYYKNAVIATDFGETNKLVDETNGYLVGESEQEICDRILYLFDNPSELQKKMEVSRDKVINMHSVKRYYEYVKSLHL